MALSLPAICDDLARNYRAHTIFLYGSHADDSAGPDSDIDIAAFAPVERVIRDARRLDGVYLDLFIYPEALMLAPGPELLKLRASRILAQRAAEADRFLECLDELYARGPEPLPPDEIAVRRNWPAKMLERARRGDVEGRYRRVWLLTALLEDYFYLRGMWFEGPKKSFERLREIDAETFHAFDRALEANASDASLHALIDLVTDIDRAAKLSPA